MDVQYMLKLFSFIFPFEIYFAKNILFLIFKYFKTISMSVILFERKIDFVRDKKLMRFGNILNT